MKKLVIVFILALAYNQSEIKAQSIVVPVGDEIGNAIDKNASEIVFENKTTGETFLFINSAEMTAKWLTLSPGKYRVEYTVDGERTKINNINI